ncbi:MAG: hypothetical protein CVU10_05020 [Bacteroidetes bacterium HGW-Bacteroidetes-5]|jgi:hypothetical protein|nr:MAG: hypothetical protein CVU10_05020 [Bacteroidetes bacterium HGW-Bacteroidetes-5]
MRKYLSRVLTIVICISLTSCISEKISNELEVISFEGIRDGAGFVNLSEVASSVKYIPLETNDYSLLDNAPRPVMESGNFYIFSGKESCYKAFSGDGKFIGRIGRKGRATGEYVHLQPFSLSFNFKNGNPLLHSYNKIIEYDNDGKLVKEVLAPDTLKSYTSLKTMKLGKNYLALYGNLSKNRYKFFYFDSQGRIIDEYPKSYELSPVKQIRGDADGEEEVMVGFKVMITPSVYNYKDYIKVITETNDTIFSFGPQFERHIDYILDYGKEKTPDYPTDTERENSLYINSRFTCESDNFIFFRIHFPATDQRNISSYTNLAIYSKEKKELTLLKNSEADFRSLTGLRNDIDNGIPFWPSYISKDGEMIMSIPALNFIELSKEYDSPEMKKIAATLNENSNPVMVVVKLK